MKKHPDSARDIQAKFEKRWCRKGVITEMIDGNPRWMLTGPRAGLVFKPP